MFTRSRRLACMGLMVAASVTGALSTAAVSHAAAPRIPVTDYPAGVHMTYRPVISNNEMDCLWGFFCEGPVPLFHFHSQQQLHRLGGWGQFAGLRLRGGVEMGFELFASQYKDGSDPNGVSYTKKAFKDLIYAIAAHGYTRMAKQPHLLPGTSQGGSIAEVQRVGSSVLVVMACWSGTGEVEAISTVDRGSAALRRLVLGDLIAQVRQAAALQ